MEFPFKCLWFLVIVVNYSSENIENSQAIFFYTSFKKWTSCPKIHMKMAQHSQASVKKKWHFKGWHFLILKLTVSLYRNQIRWHSLGMQVCWLLFCFCDKTSWSKQYREGRVYLGYGSRGLESMMRKAAGGKHLAELQAWGSHCTLQA